MSADKQRFLDLIDKFLQGNISAEEVRLLDNFINSFPEISSWEDTSLEQKQVVEKRMLERLQSTAFAKDNGQDESFYRKVFFKYKPLKYAAVILFVIAVGAYVWHQSKGRRPQVVKSFLINPVDIKAGKIGALLTLDDGSQIVLEEMKNGIVAIQNGVQIELLDSCLVYKPGYNFSAEKGIIYNKITTPRGRQFSVVLPDGSKIWLNAASSLRYPVLFTAEQRVVEVSGEAYFEVVQKRNTPFVVKISDKSFVKVLGTRFNVCAYNDENNTSTTLLEGAVEVVCENEMVVIKSGQQARVGKAEKHNNNGNEYSKNIQILNDVDLDKVVAWKNGVFNFQNASLEEVMRQLSRWYDLDVIYENGIPDIKFYGKMGKNVSLASLLAFLKESDLHYKLEGERRVIINNE